jgi:hypothetical protein
MCSLYKQIEELCNYRSRRLAVQCLITTKPFLTLAVLEKKHFNKSLLHLITVLFQNQFDGMWRKLQTYQSGEELFGMPQTDYPELGTIRKELNLLQKLYKLYNDVIDRVSSYYDIPWGEVNIEEINNELMEFQNRYVVRFIFTFASVHSC